MKAAKWLAYVVASLPVMGAATEPLHNLILVVPDGLRSAIVDSTTAPTLERLRQEGVNFRNSHALFPTFTTANASAFATGHGLGDTGDFSNTLYTGVAFQGSVPPFLENDVILRELNMHLSGNYLHETPILTAARAKGVSVALIGKLGPVGIFDYDALKGEGSVLIDDSTGAPNNKGAPLSPEWLEAIKAAGFKPEAAGRGNNGNPGDIHQPGTWIPDFAQQQYFLEMAVKVVLPRFKEAGKPFVLVYWSRDPDGSQHNQGDGESGINGPTSLSAIRTVDSAVAALEQSLKSLQLYDTTNIVVAADHGFSTISKDSKSSPAAGGSYPDTNPNELPAGFLAMDLAAALQKSDADLKLFDPDDGDKGVDWKTAHPAKGDGVIGHDIKTPLVVVAANGGSDLIYIPKSVAKPQAQQLGAQIVRVLLEQDYVSGVFVDETRLGRIPGTLSLQDIGLIGSAVTPVPAVVVNFRSFATECHRIKELCSIEIADTKLQAGQGMHGSLSRGDTWNFMAARGPDFRKGFVDELPASNADIGMTIANLLQLKVQPKGALSGRVLTEALNTASASGPAPAVVSRTLESKPDPQYGLKTILKTQTVGKHTYVDAGGFAGRTVGLEPN